MISSSDRSKLIDAHNNSADHEFPSFCNRDSTVIPQRSTEIENMLQNAPVHMDIKYNDEFE